MKRYIVVAIGLTVVANSFSPAQAGKFDKEYFHKHWNNISDYYQQVEYCARDEMAAKALNAFDMQEAVTFNAHSNSDDRFSKIAVLTDKDKDFVITRTTKGLTCMMMSGTDLQIAPGKTSVYDQQTKYLPKDIHNLPSVGELLTEKKEQEKETILSGIIQTLSPATKESIEDALGYDFDPTDYYFMGIGSIEPDVVIDENSPLEFYVFATDGHKYKGGQYLHKTDNLSVNEMFQSIKMKLAARIIENMRQEQAQTEQTPDTDEERKAGAK